MQTQRGLTGFGSSMAIEFISSGWPVYLRVHPVVRVTTAERAGNSVFAAQTVGAALCACEVLLSSTLYAPERVAGQRWESSRSSYGPRRRRWTGLRRTGGRCRPARPLSRACPSAKKHTAAAGEPHAQSAVESPPLFFCALAPPLRPRCECTGMRTRQCVMQTSMENA